MADRRRKERSPRPQPKPLEGPLRRDRTDYPLRVTQMLKGLYRRYVEAKLAGEKWAGFLHYYQYLVKAVMSDPAYGIGATGNARGLLLWHSMGMGKTFAAIAIMLALWDDRDVVMLLPRALQGNYVDSLRRVIALLHSGESADALARRQDAAVRRVRFVSTDAFNAADQLSRVTVAGESLAGIPSLDGKLVIFDEFHNFCRAVINSPAETANARRIYDMVMEARNLRLVLLTGTPLSKDVFEAVPMFNMLAGYDLLPTSYEVFNRLYVDKAARRVRNRAKLANRLMGLVSHVSHALPMGPPAEGEEGGPAVTPPRSAGGFPEELPLIIERVEMAPDQYRRYLLVREKEDAESKGAGDGGPRGADRMGGPALALPGSEKKSMRSYFVKSRALSNFAPPRDIGITKVDALPDAAFTADTSPKAALIVSRIEKSPGSALVYSQFRELGGLKVIARFLRKAGYSELELPSSGSATDTPAARRTAAAAEKAALPGFLNVVGGATPPTTFSGEDEPNSILDAAIETETEPDAEPDPDAAAVSEPTPPPTPAAEIALAAACSEVPPPAKRYAIISGEVPLKDRLRIQAIFNSPENKRGAVIRALLVSKTGAEGLDLKNVRQTHALESYWDLARLQQVVARAVRMKSHDALPVEDRDVQPYLYLGVANSAVRDSTPEKNRELATIDEIFYTRASERFELILDFRRLLRSVSLECSLFGYGDCRCCLPTGEPLFFADPVRDVELADPCEAIAEREVEATPITVTGKDGQATTYYYTPDPSSPIGYALFEHSDALGGYVPLDPRDPIISVLLTALVREA